MNECDLKVTVSSISIYEPCFLIGFEVMCQKHKVPNTNPDRHKHIAPIPLTKECLHSYASSYYYLL